jgi:hypothetical protein
VVGTTCCFATGRWRFAAADQEREIRSSFADGWSIFSIEPTILETTSGFDAGPDRGPRGAPGAMTGLHGAQAWLATIERR